MYLSFNVECTKKKTFTWIVWLIPNIYIQYLHVFYAEFEDKKGGARLRSTTLFYSFFGVHLDLMFFSGELTFLLSYFGS